MNATPYSMLHSTRDTPVSVMMPKGRPFLTRHFTPPVWLPVVKAVAGRSSVTLRSPPDTHGRVIHHMGVVPRPGLCCLTTPRTLERNWSHSFFLIFVFPYSFPVHLWLTIEEQSRLSRLTILHRLPGECRSSITIIKKETKVTKQWDLIELSGPA